MKSSPPEAEMAQDTSAQASIHNTLIKSHPQTSARRVEPPAQRTCPAITSPRPQSPSETVSPQAEAPLTPEVGAGDGVSPRRLNAAPEVASFARGATGAPSPPLLLSCPPEPKSTLTGGGLGCVPGAPFGALEALASGSDANVLNLPSLPVRFWLCMV